MAKLGFTTKFSAFSFFFFLLFLFSIFKKCFLPPAVVLRIYADWTQGSLLVGLRKPYVMSGIEHKLCACKTRDLLIVLFLWSPFKPHFIGVGYGPYSVMLSNHSWQRLEDHMIIQCWNEDWPYVMHVPYLFPIALALKTLFIWLER